MFIFSILGRSRTNQCSRHFSKKSIPGLFYLELHRKTNATTLELYATNFKNLKKNRPTRFQTSTCGRNLGFQKPGICPWQPPRGVCISRNDHKKSYFTIILVNHQKAYFCDKTAFFFYAFFWAPCLFWAPI